MTPARGFGAEKGACGRISPSQTVVEDEKLTEASGIGPTSRPTVSVWQLPSLLSRWF